jgi:hypothetical protein
MPSPIELANQLLSTTPRDLEYLDFGDTSSWSAQDRRAVADMLIDAAEKGDSRAPPVLAGMLPPSEREPTLLQLLMASQASVRAAAGEQLVHLWRHKLQTALYSDLVRGESDDLTLARIGRLFLSIGDRASVIQAATDATNERARTGALKALWRHYALDAVPTVWWRGLGLLRRRLDIPVRSFRDQAQHELVVLLEQPAAALPREDPATPMPPELARLVADARDGKGPIDADALHALPADLKAALLVNVAGKALDLKSPRCLEYAAILGGSEHRDLFELAAQSPTEAFAAAARAVLTRIAAN